jgi:hypothetical protein
MAGRIPRLRLNRIPRLNAEQRCDLLLQAAYSVRFGEIYTKTEWVIAAWAKSPEEYGIPGYRQYPDSNRVIMDIYSGKGCSPIGKKYIEKVAPNLFRFTPLGLARIREPQILAAIASASKNIGLMIQHDAYKKWTNDPSKPEDWNEAQEFFKMVPNPWEALDNYQPLKHEEIRVKSEVIDFLIAMGHRFPKQMMEVRDGINL